MLKLVRQIMNVSTISLAGRFRIMGVGRPPKQENYLASAVEKVIKNQKIQSPAASPFMIISASLLLAINPFQVTQFVFSCAVRCISFWHRRICRKP